MSFLEKAKSFYLAGKVVSKKMRTGDPLNAMTIKEAFNEVGAKSLVSSTDILSLSQYTKGLLAMEPNGNMGYYEALGYSASKIEFNAIRSNPHLCKAIREKANKEGFLPHPTQRTMTLNESLLISSFNMGLMNKEVFSFGC
jgi:hypothetical protein